MKIRAGVFTMLKLQICLRAQVGTAYSVIGTTC